MWLLNLGKRFKVNTLFSCSFFAILIFFHWFCGTREGKLPSQTCPPRNCCVCLEKTSHLLNYTALLFFSPGCWWRLYMYCLIFNASSCSFFPCERKSLCRGTAILKVYPDLLLAFRHSSVGQKGLLPVSASLTCSAVPLPLSTGTSNMVLAVNSK